MPAYSYVGWRAETIGPLDLRETLKTHPEHRGSIGQVLDKKGYLVAF